MPSEAFERMHRALHEPVTRESLREAHDALGAWIEEDERNVGQHLWREVRAGDMEAGTYADASPLDLQLAEGEVATVLSIDNFGDTVMVTYTLEDNWHYQTTFDRDEAVMIR